MKRGCPPKAPVLKACTPAHGASGWWWNLWKVEPALGSQATENVLLRGPWPLLPPLPSVPTTLDCANPGPKPQSQEPWTETSETVSPNRSFLLFSSCLGYFVTVAEHWLTHTKVLLLSFQTLCS